jgi:hypothetical protein
MVAKTDRQNFVVLSVNIRDVESRTARDGSVYSQGEGLATIGRSDVGVRVLAFKKVAPYLTKDAHVIVGSLGYEEWEGRDGFTHTQLVLFADRIEAPREDRPLRNYAILSLRAVTDAIPAYTNAGKAWTRVRAALGMGKDRDGHWRPSLFLNLKTFAREVKDGEGQIELDENGQAVMDERVPTELRTLSKGARFTASGSLTCEMYKDRPCFGMVVGKVEIDPQEASEVEEGAEAFECSAALEAGVPD